eukprot:GHVU01160997.1.p1 GENE.GHVU01160997.1~~GHVU01160997.1.p1  ORF type:complete len:162 (+),score=17.38 GHVU01160997.1:123-608(+)
MDELNDTDWCQTEMRHERSEAGMTEQEREAKRAREEMDAAITCDTFLPNTSTNNRTPDAPTPAPVTASKPIRAGSWNAATATSVAPKTAATPLRPANVAPETAATPLRPANQAVLKQPELSLTSQKEIEDHAKQIEEALEISTVRDGAPPGLVATLFIVRS